MASNSQAIDNRVLADIVSSVPPVPPEVVAKVSKTAYARRNSGWQNFQWNLPQMLTALVLIEQSPAGKAWGVELSAIPEDTETPSDTRYSHGCGSPITETTALVEWFFKRSKLSEHAPMAAVNWNDTAHMGSDSSASGIPFSCDAILRMLYAAQELQSAQNSKIMFEKEQRLVAMENKVTALEAQVAALNLKLNQAITGHPRASGAPTKTCLMQLFAGHMSEVCACTACTTCTPSTEDTHGGATVQKFTIAPHTDRLSDLSLDAQNWLLGQLDTRAVWVRATDPNASDNHISWSEFDGAVKMGKGVVFSYGNYRFW